LASFEAPLESPLLKIIKYGKNLAKKGKASMNPLIHGTFKNAKPGFRISNTQSITIIFAF